MLSQQAEAVSSQSRTTITRTPLESRPFTAKTTRPFAQKESVSTFYLVESYQPSGNSSQRPPVFLSQTFTTFFTANSVKMGETKATQEALKQEMDQKLALSRPSRELLEELALAAAKTQTPESTFQYAFALSKSSEKSELRYAVTILDGLVKEGYQHQVDCMYGAATALYLLREYDEARSRCEAILRAQPQSRTAKELHLCCIEAHEQEEKKKMKQAAITSAAVAGAIGVVAGVASMMMKK